MQELGVSVWYIVPVEVVVVLGVACRVDGMGVEGGWREMMGKARDLFVVDDAGHVCVLPCHGEYDAVFERGEFLAGVCESFVFVCFCVEYGVVRGKLGWARLEVWVVFGLMPRRWFW